ncbi:cation channel family protein (macronuclear) [Tetrahymena thermophila SB210]|uniref:Cation channel family protein n=1 Tax=Tetrahymena thermophila (strain SB210) TaxID=312017 RepID=I7M136_TETTS|nr:cation channel family protein [Tetrahymena thermophila SB210]EAR94170.2 cation channel family protein [Tetrahymena thermophila SB210]|eukprot:XP_001014415.2 cation channel family protein [Tetrahymena thermophila SB210]
MSQEENNYLRFGDKIVIKGFLSRGQQDYGGFLCAKGFTQSNISFQVIPNDILQKSSEYTNNLSFLKNYNDFVFQIWPRLNFQASKEYRHHQKRVDYLQKNIEKLVQDNKRRTQRHIAESYTETQKIKLKKMDTKLDVDLQKLIDEKDQYESISQTLKENVQRENEMNLKSLNQFQGQPVGYGTEIQIMHVDSGLFLSSQTIASDSEKSAYKFQLSKDYSSGMIFRILPKYRLRNIGDTIQYRDQMIIQSVKLRFSVSFSEEQAEIGKNKQPVQDFNEYKQVEEKKNDKISFIIDTYISQYSEVAWEFRKYSTCSSQNNLPKSVISGGDFVRFFHSETEGYLTADIAYQNQLLPQVYLGNYNGTYEQEKYSISSVWQIEQINDYNKGGPISISQDSESVFFYLRHVQTGRLLSFNQGGFSLDQDKDNIQQLDYQNAFVQFIQTKASDIQYLENQQSYHISILKNYMDITKEPEQVLENNENVQIPGFYQGLKDKEFNFNRQIINSDLEINDENALQIQKLSEQEKSDILFSLSAQPVLIKFVNIFKYKQSSDLITHDLKQKVTQSLEQLIRFVCELNSLDETKGILDCQGFCIQKNQRLLKDCQFIQILTSLLYYPFKNNYYNPKNLKLLPKDIIYIFQLTNVLIKYIIREYRPNELFASQWLELLMEQAMEYDNDVDILAEPTLTELIDNNEYILKYKIDENIILKFVELLIKEKSIKFIKLLRALINCDNKAMKNNQDTVITKLLFENNQAENFINPLSMLQNGKIQIRIREVPYDLEQIKQIHSREVNEYMKFYINVIYLFSDLCMDKQFIAIEFLSKYFSYDICYTIISGQEFDMDLKSAFCSFMRTCYIEGLHLNPIQAPIYLKQWDLIYSPKGELQWQKQLENMTKIMNQNKLVNAGFYGQRYVPSYSENPDILQCQYYIEKFDNLKDFIQLYLNQITDEQLYQRIWETEFNEFTLNIIKICSSLFTYGMYNTISQINQILAPLIKFLDASRDVLSEQEEKILKKEQKIKKIQQKSAELQQLEEKKENKISKKFNRYNQTEESMILCQCRTNICEILDFANNIILNWMGDKILIQFKKFYEESNLETKSVQQILQMIKERNNYLKAVQDFKNDKNELKEKRDKEQILIPPFDLLQQPLDWINDRVQDTFFTIDSLVQKKKGSKNPLDKTINIYLIDLLLYENSDLVESAMQILQANFSKRYNLVEYLKEIQIIDDSHKISILQKAQENYYRLNNLVDDSEEWYGLNSERGQQNSQIMLEILDELFYFLTDSQIRQVTEIDEVVSQKQSSKKKFLQVDDNGDDEDPQLQLIENDDQDPYNDQGIMHDEFSSEHSIIQDKLNQLISSDINQKGISINEDYYHEFVLKKHIRQEIQKMFRLLQIHKPIVQMLLYDLEWLKQIEKVKSQAILKKCFKILSLFCFDNIQNQQQLAEYIDCFIGHLQKETNTLPQMLLNEIARNNEELLTDHKLVHKLIESYCKIINHQTSNNQQRTIMLEYLSNFMKFKGQVIRQNQIDVMLCLSNPKYKFILFQLGLGNIQQDNTFYLQCNQLSQQIENGLKSNTPQVCIPMPNELQYFIQQLELMSTACEEKNGITENKSQNYFPLEVIYELLQQTPKCWPIRRAVVQFFYHVFLETEKDIEDLEYIQKILFLIQSDLEYISNNIKQLEDSQVYVINFQGNTSLRSLIQVYTFGLLFYCVKESAERYLINQKEQVYSFYKSIIQSFVKLQAILTDKDECNKVFIAQVFFIIQQKRHIQKSSLEIKELKEHFLPEIKDLIKKYENQQINHNKQNNQSNQQKQDLSKYGKLQQLPLKFHIIFKKLSETQIFKQCEEQEFQDLSQTMKKIQILSKNTLKNNNIISFEQLCKKFCSIMNPQNTNLPDQYYLLGLKIFRNLIEEENSGEAQPAAEWDGQLSFQSLVIQRQNTLTDYGVIQVVCNFLNANFKAEIKNEAILLGIAMLYGGNQKCQQELFNCLMQDSNNTVMICLFQMIQNYSTKIKKQMSFRNQEFQEKFRQRIHDLKAKKNNSDNVLINNDYDEQKEKEAKEKEEQMLIVQEVQGQINAYEEDEIILNLKRIYRFLQLFCEGHFLPLQDFLREQKQNGNLNPQSINFIKTISQNFGSLIRYLNDKTIDLGQQMIDLLIESLQGPCQLNQKCLSDNRIVDYIKELLSTFNQESDYEKRGIVEDDLKDQIDEMVSKSTILLVSLLEGNTEQQIPLYIDQQLDYGFIRQFLTNQFQQFVTEDLEMNIRNVSIKEIIERVSEKQQEFTGQIEMAFNMFILLATISDQLKRLNPDLVSEAQKCIEQKTENIEDQAIEFFSQNTCNIEVFFQDKICRVFFVKHPACRNISKHSREEFMNEVERGTLNDKLGSLMEEAETFFTEMDHMTQLKGWIIHFTSERYKMLKWFSTIVVFAINITMIASFERKLQEGYTVIDRSQTASTQVIYALGIIQLVTNFIMMMFWLVVNGPMVLTQKWRKYNEENQYLLDPKQERLLEELDNPKYYSTQLVTYALKTKGPNYPKFQQNSFLRFGNLWGQVKYYESSFMFMLKDGSFVYLCFYISCTVLGFFFDNIVYSIQLLDIINQFPSLKNVTRAVQLNANQLLKTLLLGIIVIFIFSVVGYTFAVDSFFSEEIGHGENMCSNLFQCFIDTLNYGLRTDGGISNTLRRQSFEFDNRGTYIFRVIYDVSWFALINVIFINIIFGVIIDTFGQLRDKKREVIEDMKNVCFICGLERYVFDKHADGFNNHIERDHQLWNYIFYMYYLSKKDSTDFNGVETEVIQKIKNEDISWFPMMKSLSLGEIEKKNGLGDKVINNLDEMSDSFKDLQEKIIFLQTQLKKEQQMNKIQQKALNSVSQIC